MFGFRLSIRSRRLLIGLWLTFWIAMAIATHIPVPAGYRIPIQNGDKLLHVLIYFVLTMLGGRVLLAGRNPPTVRHFVLWAVIYAAYGAVDELLQPFIGRTASIHDWLADVFGIGVATSILSLQLQENPESEGSKPS